MEERRTIQIGRCKEIPNVYPYRHSRSGAVVDFFNALEVLCVLSGVLFREFSYTSRMCVCSSFAGCLCYLLNTFFSINN